MAEKWPTARRLAVRCAAITIAATIGFVAVGPDSHQRAGEQQPAASTRPSGAATPTTAKRVTTTSATIPKTTVAPSTTTAPRPMETMPTAPAVVAATTPSTQTVVHGGSTSAGSYCGGWITRVAAPSHLTLYDSTGGRAVTAQDCADAHAFFDQSVSATAKYADINVAKANNFRPGGDPPGQYAQHYVNWNKTPGVADPTNPEGLVYHFDASGHATLIGLYFFERSGALRQPAGPLTVWHSHTPTAARMLHVWTFPGVRDPFALMISGAR